MEKSVIARASAGEPVQRIFIEAGERVFYLANPARLDAVRRGDSEPVGFPKEDVFEFDEATFADLVEQWARQRATDPATWQTLKPYGLRASRG
jgi:hypothetical protein